MCSGPDNLKRRPVSPAPMDEGGEDSHSKKRDSLLLLELSAADDLPGFRLAAEKQGHAVDVASTWYGRWAGFSLHPSSRRMALERRTPLMIAALYGSTAVLEYILSTASAADVNRACGSDGATALHCAAAGGSPASLAAVKLLIDASADIDALDAAGNRPGDVIAPRQLSSVPAKTKELETLLKGTSFSNSSPAKEESPSKPGEKKEYPADLTLPDIKNGIYSTDEFRMYTFKVKPCSRAYSHDWTECPFVHPGENARRRDPRKYHYSCVPCPEFRKGACQNGDACEYAHGVFECWLHPAQYRTRLCKDEVGCTRRVCFFAHKPEELRPLYPSAATSGASAGQAILSPRLSGLPSLDAATAAMMLNPPMSPSSASSAMAAAALWLNQANGVMTPTLQLPSSRLKTTLSARDMDFDMDLMGLEGYRQQLIDEFANLSPRSSWKNSLSAAAASASSRAADYGDMFGTLDSSLLSQLQGPSLKQSATGPQFQSPSGIKTHPTMSQQLLSGYSSGYLPTSPPVRSSSSFGLDQSLATTIMNSRASAFAKRSQSFCDRGPMNRHGGSLGLTNLAVPAPPVLSDWGSPGGKLDWGIQGEELNKLRKSASFGFRSNNSGMGAAAAPAAFDEPDVSWVQSLVKDGPSVAGHSPGMDRQQKLHQADSGGEFQAAEMLSLWAEQQLYMEQEQMVA